MVLQCCKSNCKFTGTPQQLTFSSNLFFCLAGLTAVKLSGRQAGYEGFPGCFGHLLGPAESVFAVKQTKVACNIEIKIKIVCHKGLGQKDKIGGSRLSDRAVLLHTQNSVPHAERIRIFEKKIPRDSIPLQNSVTLAEKMRDFRKSCKNPGLFDLFICLKIGFLAWFLDHKVQNFK